MGTKSPNTVMKRANALTMFYRWNVVTNEAECIPFHETVCWRYVQQLAIEDAPATRAMSFVQALRLAAHILGCDGAMQCCSSRRIEGSAELQYAKRRKTCQARPLTVLEVTRLRQIAAEQSRNVIDRVFASHALMALYARARNSEILNALRACCMTQALMGDMCKSTHSIRKELGPPKRNPFKLPIIVSAEGIRNPSWLFYWVQNRKEAGLKVAGAFEGPLLPAPAGTQNLQWSSRPVTSTEMTDSLRALLDCQDKSLSCHSLKATLFLACK